MSTNIEELKKIKSRADKLGADYIMFQVRNPVYIKRNNAHGFWIYYSNLDNKWAKIAGDILRGEIRSIADIKTIIEQDTKIKEIEAFIFELHTDITSICNIGLRPDIAVKRVDELINRRITKQAGGL